MTEITGVYLIGAGGHAKQVADIFRDNHLPILGVFDDNRQGMFYQDIPILGTISQAHKYRRPHVGYFCTIGHNRQRAQIISQINEQGNRLALLKGVNDIIWINCLSQHAYVSPSAKLGVGNYIGVHAKILSHSLIGDHNIINDGATLTHDNQLGHFNHIAPNASLGGRVQIGHGNLIGTNATINPDLKIGDEVIIGSGAVLTHNSCDQRIYVGIPARQISKL